MIKITMARSVARVDDYLVCTKAYGVVCEANRSTMALPPELQWENCLGVDGRMYPWGNDFDPSYCCMHESHEKEIHPSLIDEYPIDCSVYGVRGGWQCLPPHLHSWKRSWDAPEEHASHIEEEAFSNRIRTMIPARSYMLPAIVLGVSASIGKVFFLKMSTKNHIVY